MVNKGHFFGAGLTLFLFFFCTNIGFGSDIPPVQDTKGFSERDAGELLERLTSPVESIRFQALESIRRSAVSFSREEIEAVLTRIRDKNVSTLIFFLMETGNDILYRVEIPARMTVENSEGSFPNIAFYYARFSRPEGVRSLFRLFETHDNQRMAICKALGETGSPEAAGFLLKKAELAGKAGSRVPMFSGLNALHQSLDKSKITSFLKSELDREEIILLSQLKTDFTPVELMTLYKWGNRQQMYALEHVFNSPEKNTKAIRLIIDDMFEKKQFDRIRELLSSDRIRNSTDERIRKFREATLKRIPGTGPVTH